MIRFVIVLLLAGCCHDLPKPVERYITHSDGIKVEARVERNYTGSPSTLFYVIEDSTGSFINHGPDFGYYQNGQVKYQNTYHFNKINGLSELWHPNGQKRGELYYREGILHGRSREWYESGKIKREKFWESGKLHGVDTKWDETGTVVFKNIWNVNKLEKPVVP